MEIAQVVAMYWVVSISMVYLNKILLSNEEASIPAPLFVTWWVPKYYSTFANPNYCYLGISVLSLLLFVKYLVNWARGPAREMVCPFSLGTLWSSTLLAPVWACCLYPLFLSEWLLSTMCVWSMLKSPFTMVRTLFPSKSKHILNFYRSCAVSVDCVQRSFHIRHPRENHFSEDL